MKNQLSITGPIALLVWVFLMPVSSSCAQSNWPRSPDGKYEATLVGSGDDVHYQVKEIQTGRVLLTTHAQYDTPNDVKARMFSPDSKEFAAAYHYGHEGPYTWIGIWNIETGTLDRTERRSGWIRDISWVFNK